MSVVVSILFEVSDILTRNNKKEGPYFTKELKNKNMHASNFIVTRADEGSRHEPSYSSVKKYKAANRHQPS